MTRPMSPRWAPPMSCARPLRAGTGGSIGGRDDDARRKVHPRAADYRAYPQILDDIKSAEILERAPGVAVVAFQLRVLLKGFDYTLRMVEHPPAIPAGAAPDAPARATLSWTLVHSKTLKQNNGGWELEAASPTETRVTYWNELAARAFLPKSFINALARIALPSMMKRWSSYAEARHTQRS